MSNVNIHEQHDLNQIDLSDPKDMQVALDAGGDSPEFHVPDGNDTRIAALFEDDDEYGYYHTILMLMRGGF